MPSQPKSIVGSARELPPGDGYSLFDGWDGAFVDRTASDGVSGVVARKRSASETHNDFATLRDGQWNGVFEDARATWVITVDAFGAGATTAVRNSRLIGA